MSQAQLEQVQQLFSAQDAAGLVGLKDHSDKAVRKAARKAIHTLRARGVEIPSEGRKWSAPDVVSELRGSLDEGAVLDMFGTPGIARILWAKPGDERGGMLIIASIAPNGGLLDFAVYGQSDGQRRKMFRDWDEQFSARRVPVQWARERIRFARERTVTMGFSAPKGVDNMLSELGDAPEARPASFVADKLEGTEASGDDFGELLMRAGAVRWPVLFDANAIFGELEKRAKGRDPEAMDTDARRKELADVAAGDETFRSALAGDIADLLDDVAIGLWQSDKLADAKRFADVAASFRASDAPEKLPEAVDLLSAQITGVVLRQQSSMQPRA